MIVDLDHPEKFEQHIREEEEKKKLQARDGDGRFIPNDTPPEQAVTTSSNVTGVGAVIKEIAEDPSLDKPVLSVTINNPFQKLLAWIKEIKNKQTTTFEFKIKIPLIALPIFLVVLGSAFTFFFNLGRDSEKKDVKTTTLLIVSPTTTPAPVTVTKTGTIKAAVALPIQPQKAGSGSATSISPSKSTSRYMLIDRNDNITLLHSKPAIEIDEYLNKLVVVTGTYDSQKQTLDIDKQSDIELLY